MLPKWYRNYKDKKEKKAEEEYQLRKKAHDQSLIYTLRFLDKETGKIYSVNFPYNQLFEVEFDDVISKTSIISINLFVLSKPYPKEHYFKYYLDPKDNKEKENEDHTV